MEIRNSILPSVKLSSTTAPVEKKGVSFNLDNDPVSEIAKNNIPTNLNDPNGTAIEGKKVRSRSTSLLVRTNSKMMEKMGVNTPSNGPELKPNLQSQYLEKKVSDSEKNEQFIKMVQKGANDLIDGKGFSKGEYEFSSSTYNDAAVSCRKAIDKIADKDSKEVGKLEKQAKTLDKAVESFAKKTAEESKTKLNEVALQDKHNEGIAEAKEIRQARLKFHSNEEYIEKQPEKQNAEPLLALSKKCMEESKYPSISGALRSELRINAHTLAEKGARILIGEGKFEEALQVRTELMKALGPVTLKDVPMLQAALVNKKAPISGAFVHDMSSKTVKGGNINVDHRIIRSDAGDKNVTTIGMTMNYHVRKNIDETLKIEKGEIIKAMENAFPELVGKISIDNDNHYIFKKCINSDEKIFAQSEGGFELGKTWTLKLEGIGKLSIPIVPEFKLSGELSPENNLPLGNYMDDKYLVENYNMGVGMGQTMGWSPCNTSIMHDVNLEMEGGIGAGNQLKYSQAMLSIVGMGPVFEKDGVDDKEKDKMLEAFHAFFPSEALKLKLDESTSNLSSLGLSSKIDEVIKKMEIKPDKMSEHLEVIYQNQEIAIKGYRSALKEGVTKEFVTIDGRKGYKVTNRSEVVKAACKKAKNPIYGFYAGVGGNAFITDERGYPIKNEKGEKTPVKLTEANIQTAIRMLKGGMKSNIDRLNEGTILTGDSPTVDIANGGGKKLCVRPSGKFTDNTKCNNARLAGAFQFLIGLEALDEHIDSAFHKTDAYAAYDPSNITKCLRNKDGVTKNDVLLQGSVTNFAASLSIGDIADAEVLLDQRLNPAHFKGIVVANQENLDLMKAGLLAEPGLFDKDQKINGIHISKFIMLDKVGFTEDMYNK